MITIAEYVEWKQPKVYSKLLLFIEKVKILAFVKFLEWKQIMEEPPKPGLAGLLEGEKAV